MEGFVVPAIMIGLFSIPLGIELFSGHHSHGGDEGDTETDDSGNNDPIQIQNEDEPDEYAVMADFNAGDQNVDGTKGKDVLFGGTGTDIINGTGGSDVIDGGSERDLLTGDSGDDILITADLFSKDFSTQDLIDAVKANTSGDIAKLSIFSDKAALNMTGEDGSGFDDANGGDGEDTIIFGQGDTMRGGSGADTYIGIGSQLSSENVATIKSMSRDDTLILTYDANADNTNIPKITTETNDDGSISVFMDGKNVVQMVAPPKGFSAESVMVKPYTVPITEINDNPTTITKEGDLDIVDKGESDEYAILATNSGVGNEGNAGVQKVDGTKGDDIFFAGSGDDVVDSKGGRDVIDGGAGKDTLVGDTGNDILISAELFKSGFTSEQLLASAEANTSGDIAKLSIFSENAALNKDAVDNSGVDEVVGRGGDDMIIFGKGDVVNGGEGADTYVGLVSQLNAEAKAVIQDLQDEDKFILAYQGNTAPVVTVEASTDTSGTPTTYVLVDGKAVVTVMGKITADKVILKPYTGPITEIGADGGGTGGGDSTITKEGNLDIVDKGKADQYAILSTNSGVGDEGNAGDQKILVTSGDDIFFAGSGNDTVDSKGGNDVIDGGSGDDKLVGDTGDDILISAQLFNKGFSTQDLVAAVKANTSDDIAKLSIFSDKAALNMEAVDNSGADEAVGRSGNDTIIFGQGDTVRGGEGADTYIGLVSQLNAEAEAKAAVIQEELQAEDKFILAYQGDTAPVVKVQTSTDATTKEVTTSVLLDDKAVVTVMGTVTADQVILKRYDGPITEIGADGGGTGGGESTITKEGILNIVNKGTPGEYAILTEPDNAGNQVGATAQTPLPGATSGKDIFFGGAGDDRLTGLAGNDVLDGGIGGDFLTGADGDDILIGADLFSKGFTAQQLVDSVDANTSGDIAKLSIFSDKAALNATAEDNSGIDRISGGEGEDTIIFGQGDKVRGGNGADTYIGIGSQLSSENVAEIKDMSRDDTLILTYDANADNTNIPTIRTETETIDDGKTTIISVFMDDKIVVKLIDPVGFSAESVMVKPNTVPITEITDMKTS